VTSTAAHYLGFVIRRGWVLVTDGGSGQGRSALAAVRALAGGGYPAAVTVSGRHSLAAASRHCARKVEVPPVSDPARYKEAIAGELRARPYLTTMATSDAALLALKQPVKHLVDKFKLAERALKAGLEVPPTRRFESATELLDSADELDYPVVVKPGVSRWPAACVDDRSQLAAIVRNEESALLVQPFLADGLVAVCGVMWNKQLVAVSHQRYSRTWPALCGTASAATTVEPDLDLEKRIVKLLAGYDGIFQAQLAAGRLLDLNARPYGSMPLAVAAGVNFARIYCDLLHGVEPAPTARARPGVHYRWIEGDVRHVYNAVKQGSMTAGQAVSVLKPHRRAAHSTESLRDPRPMIARLAYALRRVA
jgi:predicted ATP-grasp superfamily ATP-dependent carboligase